MAERIRRTLAAALLGAVAVASGGCGYALAGRGSYLPDHIKVVGIPPIENRTAYSRVEQVLTERVRNEFIGRGKYTPDVALADAVLRGELVGFSLQTTGLNQQQLSSRYLVTVVIKVSFVDARSNEVLWSNDALTFRDEYQLSSTSGASGSTFFDQERSVVDRIATDAARTVVTAILEAF